MRCERGVGVRVPGLRGLIGGVYYLSTRGKVLGASGERRRIGGWNYQGEGEVGLTLFVGGVRPLIERDRA